MRRGDIFALRLPRGVGHEQRGPRFGVVVQSDAFLPRSVVLVAPTSTSARPASFRPEIDIGHRSRPFGSDLQLHLFGGLGLQQYLTEPRTKVIADLEGAPTGVKS